MDISAVVTKSNSQVQTISPTTTIQPTQGWSSLGVRDVWEYRELLYFLMVREIQGIYRQTALGTSWIFLRPILYMLLLTFVFGYLVKVPSNGVPYPLFSLSALLPWGFFSNAVTRSSRSLVENMNIISKVYFPRMVIPIAGVMSGIVDFGASFVVMIVALLLYRMPFRIEMVMLPVYLLVAIGASLATGLWLSTLSVKFRDVAFAVTFFLQAMLYLSPVIYPIDLVPEPLRFFYYLNPMTGVIQGFRWAILDIGTAPGVEFLIPVGIVVAGVISGMFVFRRTERLIVDYL